MPDVFDETKDYVINKVIEQDDYITFEDIVHMVTKLKLH